MTHPPALPIALDRAAILADIPTVMRDKIGNIVVLQSVDSTNTYLLNTTIQPGQAAVCVSEAQSAGRGRRGNNWQSAANRNIMMSVAWGFKAWPESITGLGLAVALTTAERLNQAFNLSVKIKWPNDLMVAGDKLAGILIDVSGSADGACNVVVGLGLNVHQPDWSASNADYQWQDLHGLGVRQLDRNQLVSKLVSDYLEMLAQFEVSGFAPMVTRWNALSSYAGQRIQVGRDQPLVQGMMRGVDANGALLVLDDDGVEHQILDSNMSVRLS